MRREPEDHIATIIMTILALIIIVLCYFEHSEGAEIPRDTAIRAIMGEARGESYTGKLYLASALRNRGTLSGVYGINVPLETLNKEPKWVWDQCKRAWEESEHNRVTMADHWGGVACDKTWIAKAKASGKYTDFEQVGNQVFFREV